VAGANVTDEAGAIERIGLAPLLVEGAEDNIKVTTRADLALAEFLLARMERGA
jgi:2-C-methyl-D-erythritol 4-phosphate cytidylyltransferase